MSVRITIVSAFFLFVASCTSKKDIIEDLRSNDKNRIIEACAKLKDAEDSEFAAVLLENPYDQRVTHLLHYKGMSVYQQKMAALSRISGVSPSNRLTYKVDSSIVDFYRDWARDKGYVK